MFPHSTQNAPAKRGGNRGKDDGMQDRVLGITCPLFSLRTENDWGKGQIADLLVLADLAENAGASLIQILPPHELTENESSPYGAMTAFALDPTYITLSRVPELASGFGFDAAAERARLAALPGVDYAGAGALKRRALGVAFERFMNDEWSKKTARAEALSKFAESEPWVYDYALYMTLRASHNGWGFSTWPEPERERSADVVGHAVGLDDKTTFGRRILEYVYLQWIAFTEWDDVKSALAARGVALMGDLPFIVGTESADVWAHRASFASGVSLGAPPDEFSEDGQDWGLPAYTAHELASLDWLERRSKHAARLYDAFRIDHVVGFFRQWVRPLDSKGQKGKGQFVPHDSDAQEKLGAHVLAGICRAADGRGGARVIAEDLGVIPPFVKQTLNKLGVPGYKVVPWEKNERLMVRSPQEYAKLSVATFGTHDTAPITSWWADLKPWEREQIGAHAGMHPDAPEPERHVKLTRMLLAAPSNIALLQIQEILGDDDRVNLPATIGPHNWTYRVKKPIEQLMQDARISERLRAVREASVDTGRFGGAGK
jgi:4-alpha-glucanotransferase